MVMIKACQGYVKCYWMDSGIEVAELLVLCSLWHDLEHRSA